MKFCIVIPTMDRDETLFHTLKSCISNPNENLSVLVSDNCSVTNTAAVVEKLKDKRLRYVKTPHRMSMSDSFEYSLNFVDADYVMFIGADDAVFPNTIDLVESLILNTGAKAIACKQATYTWPNFPDAGRSNKLTLGWWVNSYEVRSSKKYIKRALKFQSRYCFELPSVYCGFVSTELIKSFKSQYGRYFGSVTPDAYSAIVTSSQVNEYVYMLRPFVLAGASAKSNGTSTFTQNASIEANVEFYSMNNIEVASGFDNVPSFDVIFAESYAKYIEITGFAPHSVQLNLRRMAESAIDNCEEHNYKQVYKFASKFTKNQYSRKKQKLHKRIVRHLGSIILAARALFSGNLIYEIRNLNAMGVANVYEAMLVANTLIDRKDKRFVYIYQRK